MKNEKKGLLLVLIAYITWGILPGYWRLLSGVPPLEVLADRIVLSSFFLGVLLASQGRLWKSFKMLRNIRAMKMLVVSTLLIVSNWLLYVWALGKGYFLEAGLGYYICPLITLALGRIVLKEKLQNLQKIAIALVMAGVAAKIFVSGHLPLIALGLAVTFAFYTLVRKMAAVEPMQGLFIETVIAGIPALLYMAYLLWTGHSAFLASNTKIALLLFLSGAVTALPLLWLVSGVPTTPLQMVAMIQFLAPTLMTIGGILSGDSMPLSQIPAYALIWSGIAVYLSPSVKTMLTEAIAEKTCEVYLK